MQEPRPELQGRPNAGASLHQGKFYKSWNVQDSRGTCHGRSQAQVWLHQLQLYKYCNDRDLAEASIGGPIPRHAFINDNSTNAAIYKTGEEAAVHGQRLEPGGPNARAQDPYRGCNPR